MRTLIWIASLLLVGCSTMASTPAQDRTYARLQACGAPANSAHIKPDGGWWMPSTGNSVEDRQLAACMGGILRAR
jgi:hypothetical protein